MREAPRSRLFGKQRYFIHTEFANKREAGSAAAALRARGYKVRVVSRSGGYLLYARRVAGRQARR